jgi:hypothetical protein
MRQSQDQKDALIVFRWHPQGNGAIQLIDHGAAAAAANNASLHIMGSNVAP